MVAAGAPSSSPMRNPSGSTVLKHAASPSPGFQPSPAAQSTAMEISSGRIARMRSSPSMSFCFAGVILQTLSLQSGADLLQDRGIVDGRGHSPRLAVGDLLHGTAQDFSRTRLRQPCDRNRELEGGDRTDFFAHEPDAFLLDLGRRPLDAGLKHDEAAGDLALQGVGDADHGTLRDILVRGEHLLHSTGREPMASNVDDIVSAAHDVNVAVFVLEAGIRRLVVAGKL